MVRGPWGRDTLQIQIRHGFSHQRGEDDGGSEDGENGEDGEDGEDGMGRFRDVWRRTLISARRLPLRLSKLASLAEKVAHCH